MNNATTLRRFIIEITSGPRKGESFEILAENWFCVLRRISADLNIRPVLAKRQPAGDGSRKYQCWYQRMSVLVTEISDSVVVNV